MAGQMRVMNTKALIGVGSLAFLGVVFGFLWLGRVAFAQAPRQIAYGPEVKQFGELSLPLEPGSHPVIILIHGGAWQSNANLTYTRPVAADLAQRGFAVWNIEYRAIGDKGGGFPGTFLDVGTATDYLRELAKTKPLDLSCVIVVGHSAGGLLAMWVAGRERLPTSSPLYKFDILPIRGVVDLAGPPNLNTHYTPANEWGGPGTIGKLIGLQTRGFDAALKDTSPAEMLPLGVKQVLVFGSLDEIVPADHGYLYQRDAAAKGEYVDLRIIPGARHDDFMAPGTKAWNESLAAIRSIGTPIAPAR